MANCDVIPLNGEKYGKNQYILYLNNSKYDHDYTITNYVFIVFFGYTPILCNSGCHSICRHYGIREHPYYLYHTTTRKTLFISNIMLINNTYQFLVIDEPECVNKVISESYAKYCIERVRVLYNKLRLIVCSIHPDILRYIVLAELAIL
jgi:hypothetical protein